ncbi:hypothetical protein CW304_06135 [Bacillus sp. UFRGS-B20]|nr:hypothetical protein CW304_06135 [Bacillus sp. UFRGS-B20]
MLKERTGKRYKIIKSLFSLKNNSFYFTYSKFSPRLGINITNFPELQLKGSLCFFIVRLFVNSLYFVPLHNDLKTILN